MFCGYPKSSISSRHVWVFSITLHQCCTICAFSLSLVGWYTLVAAHSGAALKLDHLCSTIKEINFWPPLTVSQAEHCVCIDTTYCSQNDFLPVLVMLQVVEIAERLSDLTTADQSEQNTAYLFIFWLVPFLLTEGVRPWDGWRSLTVRLSPEPGFTDWRYSHIAWL